MNTHDVPTYRGIPRTVATFHRLPPNTVRAYPSVWPTAVSRDVELEQPSELSGISHGEVAVAVVHQYVRLTYVLGERSDLRHPFTKLAFRVVITESFARRFALHVPRLGVATVEAHHRDVARRCFR